MEGQVLGKDFNVVVENVVGSIKNGQEEIFEIAENIRKDCDSIAKDIEELRGKLSVLFLELDDLSKKEKFSRKKLSIVSGNFGVYTEKDIKEAYEEAKDYQIKLALKREEEKNLIKDRNDLEMRLKKNQELIHRAESIMSKMKSITDFLLGDITNISNTINSLEEKAQVGIRIIKAQEEERRRIARDIHDGPAQDLASLVIKSEILEKILEKDPDQLKKEIKDLKDHVKNILKEIRGVMYDLRPSSLDDLGLIPTLRRIASDVEYEHGVTVNVNVLTEEKIHSPLINLTCFRILQEIFNNIIKHSKATEANVRIGVSKEKIVCSVEDNGQGFEVSVLKEKTDSFGVSSMRERAGLVNGTLEITSKPGFGTKISFVIPNKEAEYE